MGVRIDGLGASTSTGKHTMHSCVKRGVNRASPACLEGRVPSARPCCRAASAAAASAAPPHSAAKCAPPAASSGLARPLGASNGDGGRAGEAATAETPTPAARRLASGLALSMSPDARPFHAAASSTSLLPWPCTPSSCCRRRRLLRRRMTNSATAARTKTARAWQRPAVGSKQQETLLHAKRSLAGECAAHGN